MTFVGDASYINGDRVAKGVIKQSKSANSWKYHLESYLLYKTILVFPQQTK